MNIFMKSKIKEKELIQKKLRFGDNSESKTVEIHNFSGAITVKGYEGTDVQLKVEKTILAHSKAKIQQARDEVWLGISEKGNTIVFYMESPFTRKYGLFTWDSEKIGYSVRMDFDVEVPYQTHLLLNTVNEGNVEVLEVEGDYTIRHINGSINVQNIKGRGNMESTNGEINVRNIEGDFSVKTTNGKIHMTDIIGSGEVRTNNGEVMVSFKQNPEHNSLFHTLNGKVEIIFTKKLSADFYLKTLNGSIISDFPAAYLPGKGKYIYKTNQTQKLRVGNGGPEIRIDTLNGGINIRRKEN